MTSTDREAGDIQQPGKSVFLCINVNFCAGLEEFQYIDTKSDPLQYSTCNSKSIQPQQFSLTGAKSPAGPNDQSSYKKLKCAERKIPVADSPPGYPMLARFTASAPEFYIFREFRYLQSRVLLHLQDEIRALETQLWRLDERDRINNPHNLQCRELDDAYNKTRKMMMDQIQHKMVRYGELLCVSSKLAALERPSTFESASLQNFFLNKQPLVLQEGYIGNIADLVTLKAERDDAWLDRQILGLLVRANSRFLSCIFSTKRRKENNGGSVVLYSLARVHFFVMMLLIITMLFLFSAPLVPLYEWSQAGVDGRILAKMMGFQVACTLAFGGVLALCTRAKKHEIYGACAAYVAILVVFVGQSANQK